MYSRILDLQEYQASGTEMIGKRKNYFPFSDFYGILRKTFDIEKSRNALERFWIRQRDDTSRGVVFVYCIANFDRREKGAVAHWCAPLHVDSEIRILRLRCAPLRMTREDGFFDFAALRSE